MAQNENGSKTVAALARTFTKLGWCGFWAQVVVGAAPVLLMAYLFLFARSPGPRAGFALVEYLSTASLLTLVFTTFWAFRYMRLGRKLATSERPLPFSSLTRAAWIGIVASTIGILFSMLVMLIEVAHLLFYFLSTPQGGVPVIQTTGEEAASWVSAVDMLSLMALLLALFAELLMLVISLWLLFRTTLAAAGTASMVIPEDQMADPAATAVASHES